MRGPLIVVCSSGSGPGTGRERGFSSSVRESGRWAQEFVTSGMAGPGLRQRRPCGPILGSRQSAGMMEELAVVAEVVRDLGGQVGEARRFGWRAGRGRA